MYEENNDNFALKNIILKILFIVLIIFIVIWLFPTKGYMDNAIDKKLGTAKGQVFNNNVSIMKEAATNYYNGSRLPQNEGDTKKLTLKQMINKNLLVEFTDSKGKKCNDKESYVSITKNKDDYKLNINLVCSDNKAKIISYLGAYDYCQNGLCEKKKLTEENNDSENNTSDNSVVSNEQTESNTSKADTQCQYVKSTGYNSYGNWSNWTTTKINSSSKRQVETKTERVQIKEVTINVGSQTERYNPRKLTYSNGAVIYLCGDEYNNAGRYTKPTYCYKSVPKYEKRPVYSNVTYYRYRDIKYVNGKSDYKWDTCDSSSLLNQGYKKTGKMK